MKGQLSDLATSLSPDCLLCARHQILEDSGDWDTVGEKRSRLQRERGGWGERAGSIQAERDAFRKPGIRRAALEASGSRPGGMPSDSVAFTTLWGLT